MARIPKDLARITSHTKPRYQLYQPGFNPSNACWLSGEWVTVTKAEWTKRKASHQKTYGKVRDLIKTQHYRNKGKDLKNLTPAERQAYESFSGQQMLHGTRKGVVSPCRINMAGTRPKASDLAWLRREAFKFPRYVKHGPKGKVADQLRGLDFPADLIDENSKAKAFDYASAVVATNKSRMSDFFDSAVQAITSEPPTDAPVMNGQTYQQFAATMALQQLIDQEEAIVRGEWEKSRGEDWLETDLNDERAKYVSMRAKLKVAITSFDEAHDLVRKNHNKCERRNLDNSEGHLFCFVLPKFNDDGSHEPVGERDVPWGQKPRKHRMSSAKSSATV